MSRNLVKTIIERAADTDLTIVGATGQRRLLQLTRGSLPEMLAQRLHGPLIMVKAKTPVKSWLNRWV